MGAETIALGAAARRFHPALKEALPPTPLERVRFAGSAFHAKREDLQATGSFKVRGALHRSSG